MARRLFRFYSKPKSRLRRLFDKACHYDIGVLHFGRGLLIPCFSAKIYEQGSRRRPVLFFEDQGEAGKHELGSARSFLSTYEHSMRVLPLSRII